MHEPERLLDGDLRPVERNILRAAEQDAPSEAARAAARAALGLDAPPPPPPAKPSWPIAAASGAVLVGALWLGVSLISVAPPPPAPAVVEGKDGATTG